MRFDEIILNEGRSKPIDQKQAFDLIKTKCSDMFDAHKSNYHIYRGTLSGRAKAPLYFEAGDSIRVSANTENTITLLVDNAVSWSNIPKRSKSLICSSNASVASGYGEVYAVFPFNGSKIAIGIE